MRGRSGSSGRRWSNIFRRAPRAEVEDELAFHLEERVAEYVARGLEPEAARAAALERLGELERVRLECTDLLATERHSDERRRRLVVSWLDVKLGLRMLLKYPGLSSIAVIGMAVAIAIGAGYFAFIGEVADPSLPLDEGDRIVAIQNNRTGELGSEDRRVVHDFGLWREELRSVQDLGAFRARSGNLAVEGGITEVVRFAEMSASGFRLTRVPPLLGRPLLDEDEREGAPPVLVIAYEEWRTRFEADPAIIGTEVRLAGVPHTVVGVMPEGFGFPISHRFWVPLRLDPLDYPPGSGPEVEVFGRLADGFSLRQAGAELATIGQRMAAAYPASHERLRAVVLPYTHAAFGIDSPAMALALRLAQLLFGLLLVVVAVNVAILIYARTVTRAGEIAVRTALGASRRRVVWQLFAEAVVLTLLSAIVGLTLAGTALELIQDFIERNEEEVGFWIDLGLSAGTVVYVVGLAILGALIVGVVPALQATGRNVRAGLQQISSGGSRMQLGRTWTMLIVAQVAIAIATLPAAGYYAFQSALSGTEDPGYAADELLSARIQMEGPVAPGEAPSLSGESAPDPRLADRAAELMRRLGQEPDIADVTFASSLRSYESTRGIEIARPGIAAGATGAVARTVPNLPRTYFNRVAGDFFDVLDVPILAGRNFNEADASASPTAIIVNRELAERIDSTGQVLGTQIRLLEPSATGDPDNPVAVGPWLEIVGIVPNFPTPAFYNGASPQVYQPLTLDQIATVTLALRARDGPPAALAPRLREIALAVDPGLELHDVESVAESRRLEQRAMRGMAIMIGGVTLSVLLLSAGGIYAMMSFTVARRRREIGIRTALGADRRRVLTGIFAKAAAQLGAGALFGLLVAAILARFGGGELSGEHPWIPLLTVTVIMLTVGMLAALGPARRGLAVQPMEALREE